MVNENPYSPPKHLDTESRLTVAQHLYQLAIHMVGFGSLVAFASFLLYSAKRYHSVYGWAHGAGRNVSPEQYYQSANNAVNAIFLVAAIAAYFTVKGKYTPGKIAGGLCVIACLILLFQGCGHVCVRF